MLRFLPLVTLVLAVAACDAEPPDPARTVAVPEADVERFRAEIFERTLDIDADLAELEGEATAADSALRVAYEPVLERLRRERRSLQVRLDSLAPRPPAFFDSTRAAVRTQTDRLAASVVRARYDAAPTYAALQSATSRGLADLDARLAALRAAALADTTGRQLVAVDSLAADRARLAARVGAYPDTSAGQFRPFRESVTDGLLGLNRRADALAADTARAPARSPRRAVPGE